MALATATKPAVEARTGESVGSEYVDDTTGAPRLLLLQALSPQVTEGDDLFFPGAKPGHFFVAGPEPVLFGEKVYVLNAFFRLRHLVWRKRRLGGGLLGVYRTAAEAQAHEQREPQNSVDVYVTHEHFLLPFNEEGDELLKPVLYPMRSTAVNASRTWNQAIQQAHSHRFAKIWELNRSLQKNEQGTWYSPVAKEAVPGAGWAHKEHFEIASELYKGLLAMEQAPEPQQPQQPQLANQNPAVPAMVSQAPQAVLDSTDLPF